MQGFPSIRDALAEGSRVGALGIETRGNPARDGLVRSERGAPTPEGRRLDAPRCPERGSASQPRPVSKRRPDPSKTDPAEIAAAAEESAAAPFVRRPRPRPRTTARGS